ncbi:hypothetical protein ASPZODRAFT_157934 [Penicilliopsis zonata CBS 506.65]|uniref:Cytochrome P450 n=1 Tax=Penicilliopsis zonata CBS 506.65 TaxID=1073090 RepID=A0A1L9SM18_9EURO|nr:hypothetical protein ASPZODRAFT_157934 [Penicilliopsis zonata CBS 506.65]OJJ48141.1 hypothetical protein ASPZODRAFT_157934 [Penicilliopsis zonata CBS 506.65]
MTDSSLLVLAAIVLLAVSLHRRRTSLKALDSIPIAHPLCGLSSLVMHWVRFTGHENRFVQAAHEKYGPVVRLAPRELSVNSAEGVRVVYGGGFEKHPWYRSFFNVGRPNMFSTYTFRPHADRKRMLSHVYSKSFIQGSPALKQQSTQILHDRLLPILQQAAGTGEALDVHDLLLASAMDFVTAFLFGLSSSSNLVEDRTRRQAILSAYQSRLPYAYYAQETQGVMDGLQKIGFNILPAAVVAATEQFEAWCISMVDGAEEKLHRGGHLDAADQAVVYGQLRDAMLKTKKDESGLTADERMDIVSEMCDHIIAGHETSGIALTYLVYEMSKNRDLQDALRAELTSAPSLLVEIKNKLRAPDVSLTKQLDALPFLDSVIQEILRLVPPIGGPQTRLTPSHRPTKLGDFDEIPPGIRISARAYCLHRNPAVFPDPDRFNPYRWMEPGEHLKEMKRWFWAFGSGGRMCIGNNFAIQELKLVTAALYANFFTEVVETSAQDMQATDSYSAYPTGGKLMVRLREI